MSGRKKKGSARKTADVEMTKMAKTQLFRLKRQYKIMESSRKTFEEEMNVQLGKQKAQIENLKIEKNNLLSDGVLQISEMFSTISDNFSKQLVKLFNDKIHLCEKIRLAHNELYDVSKQVLKANSEILHLKKTNSNIEKKLESVNKNAVKQTGLLENKLSIATVELNKIIARNQTLREEIQHFLKERTMFKDLLDNLLDKIAEGKQYILEMIEQATIAYEHREEAQTKLQMLQERCSVVEHVHSQQVRELDRQLYKDIERIRFLTIKGQHRITSELEAKQELKDAQERKETEETIKKYEKLLSQLHMFNQEQDVDNLCALFQKAEEENYALFNYVNEVNCEAEILQEIAQNLMAKIEEEKKISIERTAIKVEDMKVLEQELANAIKEADKIKGTKLSALQFLDTVLESCKELFFQTGCYDSPFYALLGEAVQMAVHNVDMHLKVLEKYILWLNESMTSETIKSPALNTNAAKTKSRTSRV